ncbi:MAG: histidinol-phosphate transaminase [Chloroflexota bacterium]
MIEPKKSIKNTPPAHHGAFDYDELARLGYSPDEVIDFSVNSNPYGPPESVREAIASVPLDRYPDRECIALREKLAEHHNTNIENIVVGNGTAELLMLIAQAFIRESDEVLVVGPTFSEYERVAKLMGANVNTFNARLNHRNEFFPPFQKIRTFIEEHQPRIAFMCNPNNPTGFTLYGRSIHNQFAEVPLAVIDEAYVNFASDLGLYKSINFDWQQSPNLLMLRSLTKDFAIAGLRLGYAVGHTDVIEAIRRVRPAWNVNAMALAAGECIVGNSNPIPSP